MNLKIVLLLIGCNYLYAQDNTTPGSYLFSPIIFKENGACLLTSQTKSCAGIIFSNQYLIKDLTNLQAGIHYLSKYGSARILFAENSLNPLTTHKASVDFAKKVFQNFSLNGGITGIYINGREYGKQLYTGINIGFFFKPHTVITYTFQGNNLWQSEKNLNQTELHNTLYFQFGKQIQFGIYDCLKASKGNHVMLLTNVSVQNKIACTFKINLKTFEPALGISFQIDSFQIVTQLSYHPILGLSNEFQILFCIDKK